MTKTPVLICVDAGGTTTKINIYDLDGNVLKNSIIGVGSPAITKDLEFTSLDLELERLIEEIKDIYQVQNITMGISGLGVVPDVKKVVKKFTKKYNCKIVIENDAIIALYSVVAKSPLDIVENKCPNGILVLGGTGSAICGIKDGKTKLVGGWGQIIGERGSAYAVVHQACLKMIKKLETKKSLSELDKALLLAMGIKKVTELKSIFYLKTKGEIASFAKVVTNLAEAGNKEAIRILQNEAVAIVHGVITLANLQKLENGALLGFKGGLFKEDTIIMKWVKNILEYHKYEYNYLVDDNDPIIGAYYLAKATYLMGEKNA